MTSIHKLTRGTGGLARAVHPSPFALGHSLVIRHWSFVICLAVLLLATTAHAIPFLIRATDDQTNRPIPLVHLETVDHQSFYTDSAGLAAITPPDLQNQKVFFTITSHGYEFPKDGFGYHGRAFDIQPNQTATIRLKRLNIAQRLYRITGSGIYADTILAGRKPPIDQPLLNAHVVGQDTVQSIIYNDNIYWFYGDTSRPSYPLGNFNTSGATSPLNTDPSVGINLTYFTDKNDFSKGMVQIPGPGPKWLDGLMLFNDNQGKQHLYAAVATVKDVGHTTARNLVEFDDSKALFLPILRFDVTDRRFPKGHPFLHTDNGTSYYYFPAPYPTLRVPASLAAVKDPSQYEAFTPLKPGAHFSRQNPPLDRDAAGHVTWAWKKGADPINENEQDQALKPEDRYFHCIDVETNKSIRLHGGSVNWNEFRKKWIMIAVAQGQPSSFLGEVFYLEADQPQGPWPRARKIVTHDHYTFYNPKHHPFLDQDHGRLIYFEGTYAATFSGNDNPTPRYDYNQVMYLLDLSDPRLAAVSTPTPP